MKTWETFNPMYSFFVTYFTQLTRNSRWLIKRLSVSDRILNPDRRLTAVEPQALNCILFVADGLDKSNPINWYSKICWRRQISCNWSECAPPNRSPSAHLQRSLLTLLGFLSPRLTSARAGSGRRRSPAESKARTLVQSELLPPKNKPNRFIHKSSSLHEHDAV